MSSTPTSSASASTGSTPSTTTRRCTCRPAAVAPCCTSASTTATPARAPRRGSSSTTCTRLHAELHQRDYRYAKPGPRADALGPRGHRPRPVRQPDRLPPARRGRRRRAPTAAARRPARSSTSTSSRARPSTRSASTPRRSASGGPGYSPPGMTDVEIEPGIGGACMMRWPTGRRTAGAPSPPGSPATSGWTSPSLRTPTTRAGSTCGSTPTGEAPGCASATEAGRPATWPAGRGSASGRSSWTGSSRGRKAGPPGKPEDNLLRPSRRRPHAATCGPR